MLNLEHLKSDYSENCVLETAPSVSDKWQGNSKTHKIKKMIKLDFQKLSQK